MIRGFAQEKRHAWDADQDARLPPRRSGWPLFVRSPLAAADTNGIIVYQTDFGLKDGAVSAMRGVAVSVDPTLRLENLTHEIPAFDIWEGAYRLTPPRPTGRPARCSSR